jgi:hypothetical protein
VRQRTLLREERLEDRRAEGCSYQAVFWQSVWLWSTGRICSARPSWIACCGERGPCGAVGWPAGSDDCYVALVASWWPWGRAWGSASCLAGSRHRARSATKCLRAACSRGQRGRRYVRAGTQARPYVAGLLLDRDIDVHDRFGVVGIPGLAVELKVGAVCPLVL